MNYLVHLFSSLFVLLFDLLLLLLFFYCGLLNFLFFSHFSPSFHSLFFATQKREYLLFFFFINQLSLYFSFCHETLSF